MTEHQTCESCGHRLSPRAIERGFKRCFECFKKSKEANGPAKAGPAPCQQAQQATHSCLKNEASEISNGDSMTGQKEERDFFEGWPVISSYTTEQAVEDGVLVYVGDVSRSKVYFTRTLFEQGYENEDMRKELVNRGLELLRKPDPEDTGYMGLRVIEKDKIWVVAEPGKLTYMTPDDY